jgi:hypothetical protein
MSSSAMVIPVVVVGLPAAVVAGGFFLAKWLANSTPEDRAAVARLRAQRRRERLMIPSTDESSRHRRAPKLITAHFQRRDPKSIQHTATQLGYRVVKTVPPRSAASYLLLARPSGDRLAIGRDPQGRVTVTASNERDVKALVRCHVVDQALEHLTGTGMKLQTVSLPNGEMRLTGREPRAQSDGAAKITTQVHRDGSLFVDVDDLNSNRCETIIANLADAVGGKVSEMKLKHSAQLPVSRRRRVKL